MPLCYAAPVGVVYALFRDREDALLGEEELLDRPFGRSMTAVGGVSLESCAVERGNAPLHRCESVQQGWRQLRCSRGCCRSTAVLETCQRQRSLRAWEGGVVLEEAAARMQAVDAFISYRSLRNAAHVVRGASSIGGAYLVPVRLHSDSTFAGVMCL